MEDTQITQFTQEGGNTKTPSIDKKRFRKLVFTLNNYNEKELLNITDILTIHKYIIGREIGETNQTPHLQGYVELKGQKSFKQLKEMFPRAHIEPAKGNRKENIAYCSKEKNFLTNFDIPAPIRYIQPSHEWQFEILELIRTEPDTRTIHWYVDEIGGMGKTQFCKYIASFQKFCYITGGKANDIIHNATEIMTAQPTLDLFIFDFPRCVDGKVSYSSIEQIKNGFWTSNKYEGGTILMNCPHVIIFANWYPEQTMLSLDRWKIMSICEDGSAKRINLNATLDIGEWE